MRILRASVERSANGWVGLALSGVMAALSAGCSSDDGRDKTSVQVHAPVFVEAAPFGDPACAAVDARLQGERELRLFFHGDVEPEFAAEAVQRYFRRHGLRFFMTRAAQRIEQSYVLMTDNAVLGAALVKKFPNVDFTQETFEGDPALYDAILRFTLNLAMRSAVDFATEHGDAGQSVTNIVVLPHLNSVESEDAPSLAGLALSRPLLKNIETNMPPVEGDATAGLFMLDLAPDFTPMLFLDDSQLSAVAIQDSVARDLVVAHEFGHTGGLEHRPEEPSNLMFPTAFIGGTPCTSSLDSAQLDEVQRNLFGVSQVGPGASAQSAPHPRAAAATFPAQRFVALVRGDERALSELISWATHGHD